MTTLKDLEKQLHSKCDSLNKYLIPDLVNIVKLYLTVEIGLDVLQYFEEPFDRSGDMTFIYFNETVCDLYYADMNNTKNYVEWVLFYKEHDDYDLTTDKPIYGYCFRHLRQLKNDCCSWSQYITKDDLYENNDGIYRSIHFYKTKSCTFFDVWGTFVNSFKETFNGFTKAETDEIINGMLYRDFSKIKSYSNL
jgi:hypothetical protein